MSSGRVGFYQMRTYQNKYCIIRLFEQRKTGVEPGNFPGYLQIISLSKGYIYPDWPQPD